MKMARNLFLLTFGTLIVMLGIGYLTADPEAIEKPKADVVLRLFDRIAFSDQGNVETAHLRRWTQPVRVLLVGEPQNREEGEVRWTTGVSSLLTTWDSLRGLEVKPVGDVDLATWKAGTVPDNTMAIVVAPEADILAMGLPEAALARLADKRTGCTVVGADAPVLAQVLIVVRDDVSAKTRNTCLGEALARSFGLTIEAKLSADVFRVRPSGLSFHGQGRMAVELAYDPALTPGMSRSEAMEAARTVLANHGVE